MFTPDVEGFLRATVIPLRLACNTASNWPIVLSLWYLYEDGKLFCATQKSSKVVEYLEQENRCAFEIAADTPPYCGVRGQGIAHLDETRGVEILERLLQRYLGGLDHPLASRLLSRAENEIAIIIKPANLFKWNFSNRMASVPGMDLQKLCPDPQ